MLSIKFSTRQNMLYRFQKKVAVIARQKVQLCEKEMIFFTRVNYRDILKPFFNILAKTYINQNSQMQREHVEY